MKTGVLTVTGLWLAICMLCSQDTPEPKPPKALALAPVVFPIGEEFTLQVRGDNLETATEIRVVSASGELKLKPDEAKGGVPNIGRFSPKVAGTTMAKVKTTLPAAWKPGDISVFVKTPDGESEALTARANVPASFLGEKEPNNGFQDAQPIDLHPITGAIKSDNDVDVFRLEAKAGETFRIEIFANRGGSLCDPYLTIFSSGGQLIVETDDPGEHRDPTLDFTAPEDGSFFIVLQDAHRYGSEWHTWELTVTRKEES